MRTTFSRIFFPAALLLLIALLLVGISFQLLVKNYLVTQAYEELENDGSAIASLAAAYYADGSLSTRSFFDNLNFASRVSEADAVIFEQDAVHAFFKFGGNAVAQRFAAGDFVRGETDFAADAGRLGEQRGIRDLFGDAERHQRGGVGVQDGFHIGPDPIDVPVKRKFAGGFVESRDGTVFFDADDVLGAQRALVDAAGTDPHVAVGIENGEIAA